MLIFVRSLPRGMVLWSTKVPKALCQSGNVAPHPHAHQKTAALRFVFNSLESFDSALMNTKPLRLRFGSAICSILHLFFDSLPLGIDGRSSVKPVYY
jgi:hypothetical protein